MTFPVIKQRLIASLLAPSLTESVLRRAPQFAEALREDGSWEDVTGKTHGDKGAGNLLEHLERTLLLAQANHLQSGEWDDPVRRALDFWLAYDFEAPDWRQNQLRIPRLVGSVALLFEEKLSPGARGKVAEILARPRWQYWAAEGGWTDWTGNPLLQIAHNILLRGCFDERESVFGEVFSRVFATIRIAPDGAEGIQPDMVFRPSSMQPSGNHEGSAFATECARFVALAHGTPWQAGAEVTNLLATFLLNGQQWMMRNGVIDSDLVTLGGEPGPVDRPGLAAAVEQLSQFADIPRRTELALFAQRLAGRGNTLTGHRHFWRSGFSVHQRPSFYTSVRLTPARVAASGTSLSWHPEISASPEGMIRVLRSGHEYDGLRFEAADAGPPGTTFLVTPNAAVGWALTADGVRLGGGVSEGDYGAAAIQCDRAGVRAMKAWFYFDHSFVCLGAGITSGGVDGEVYTSVNDCCLDGPVTVESGPGASRLLKPGVDHELSGVERISHGGVTYSFAGQVQARVRVRAAGEGGDRAGANEPGRFTLWLRHGAAPQHASYACKVLPLGQDAAQTKIDEEISQVEVLANTSMLQAVRHRGLGLIGVTFWQAGLVTLPDGGRVAANQPCVLLCRDTPSTGKRLSIANLRHEAATVHVEYAGRSHAFTLAGGLDAGRGINRSL